MDVPHVLEEYPPPTPTTMKKTDIFNPKDYTEVDQRSSQAPEKLINSYDELIQYLTEGLDSDLAKVRSVFAWLSAQKVLSTHFPKAVKEHTPQAFLKKIKYDRAFYSDFFALLCRKAGVPCVIIEGSSKGAGYELGQRELKVTNRWNAVHVQGEWRLVNVPWALVRTDGLEHGKWILVERDGQPVREWEEAKKEVLEDMDEFWFLTDPGDFNCFCRAKEQCWQLLQEPWSADDYHNLPKFAQDYFESAWELISHYYSVLSAEGGRCQIRFAHPPDVESARLTYNLYFCPELSKTQLPNELQLDRYVLEESKIGEKALITRLPVEGVYRVEIAGVIGEDELTVLGEFRIDCVNVERKPAPFPITNAQVGPTEQATKIVSEFSHESGVVVARQGEKLDMKFHFQDKNDKTRSIFPRLLCNNIPQDQLQKYVQYNSTKNDANITVTLPNTKYDEEYALSIDVIESDVNGQEEKKYLELINYLITADKALTFPEQQESLKAKNDLLAAMKDVNIDRLNKTIAKARQNGVFDLLTQTKVNAILVQLNKIRGEKLKELHEVMKTSDVGSLEAALAEYERYGATDTTAVKQVKAVIELLRALKDEDDVTHLEKALRVVQDVKADVTAHVQRASNRLIFHYEKNLVDLCNNRSLEDLEGFLQTAQKSCVAKRLQDKPMYENAERLRNHLKEVKRVTHKIGNLGSRDVIRLSDSRKGSPHPHLHSVLIATFILLGEREQELWNWETIQNLLQKRKDTGVARAMAEVDVDRLTKQQVDLAESHVRTCQLDLVRSDISQTAAAFLEWVLMIVEEKRSRAAKYNTDDLWNPETVSFKLPAAWTSQPDTSPVERVSLREDNREYQDILDNFTSTLGSASVSVSKIERIQNPMLYRQFLAKKEHMEKQNPGIDNERTLWHGTAADAIDNINMYGFNRSYCGKNATFYGEGVYFAVNSEYSAQPCYSPPDKNDQRHMYQCKVLVGHATQGDGDMKYLPPRQGVVKYDSATDDVSSPSMYVIFNDTQAYPGYLLTFK